MQRRIDEIVKEIEAIDSNEYIDKHDLNKKEALEKEYEELARRLGE